MEVTTKPTPLRIMLAYFLVVTIDSVSFSLLAPILTPLLAKSSLFFASLSSPFFQHLLYGVILMLFPFFYLLAAPIMGWLSDNWGRKPVILFSLCLTLLAFLVYGAAFYLKNLVLLLLGRIFAGIGAANECTAQAAVLEIANMQFKANAAGMIAAGMSVGLFFGPMLASFWTRTDSTWLFASVIFLTFLNIVIFLLIVPSEANSPTNQPAVRVFFFIREKKIVRFLFLFLLLELGWSLYYQSFPLILSLHFHWHHLAIGWASAGLGGVLTLGLMFGTRVGLHYFSLRSLMRYSLIFGVLGLLVIFIFPNIYSFLICSFFIVLTVAILYPGLLAMLSNEAGLHQGLVIGLAGSLLAFAFTLNSFLASLFVYTHFALPILLSCLCWLVLQGLFIYL